MSEWSVPDPPARLGPHVGEQLRSVRGDLRGHVLTTVRGVMAGQGRSLTGGQGAGLTLGVETAVDTFVALVADPGHDLAPTWSVFHTLGRTEYQEGHRVDALRSILTVGARTIWAFLVGRVASRLAPDELYALAESLFGYVDLLAGAAAEGYLDEQRDAARDWETVRRRLVTLLVQPDPPGGDVLRAAAEAARWPVPATVAVTCVDGDDTGHLARVVGGAVLATVIDDVVVLVLPDPGTTAHLDRVLLGRRAAVGPRVEVGRARLSYRMARRAVRLQRDGVLPGDRVLRCEEHPVTLLTAWEPGLADQVAGRVLAPLAGLSPAYRRVLAGTLHAWLRAQGQVVPTARALHAHPQTVRHRLRRLRTLFGAALDDPEARLALHLALRHLGA